MSLLEIKHVNKYYNQVLVLSDINFKIENKEIIGLIGENGAGKTTLMKVICDLNTIDSGRILFKGKKDEIGILIEQPALYPQLNAIENLTFYGKALNVDNLQKKIKSLLSLVELRNERKKPVSEYSLGMRQRLGLAISLINSPRLLILDEPINGLDPKGISDFRKIIIKLMKHNNLSIIISSHILSELEMVANKICYIKNGKIIDFKKMEQLNEHYKTKMLLETPQIKLVLNLLREEFGIEGEIVSSKKIAINMKNISLEEVLKLLMENHINVSSISSAHTSLEDYFFRLEEN